MKALIIGASGFVGSHLIEHLLTKKGWLISVTKMENESIKSENIEVYNLNILDVENIKDVLAKARPDCVFHLAAQSSVALSWENPGLTVDINIKGSVNVLDAVRSLHYKPRILLIGSGEEYGAIELNENPVNEETLLRPRSVYAATKAAQNMIGKIYAEAYGMDIVSVRAFNHIGPNQSPVFVVADFCKQVAEIEKGLIVPQIKVGNLNVKRDFTDVRDVVKAYSTLIEEGKSGETYNVGSGKAISIQEILEIILSMSKKRIEVLIDKNKFRPIDTPIIEADINKIQRDTSWTKSIDLEDTIADTLEYWRKRTL